MRYFFEIAYTGRNYNGWQSQKNAIGVQAIVENIFSKLLQHDVKIVASGRTDTGVHCEQQFFHVDLPAAVDMHDFVRKLNSFLPQDIYIAGARRVTDSASARYDAIQRTYRYQITRRKNPFLAGFAWHYFKPADVPTMNAAAALLHGEQDFECFSKVKTDVNHFICHISKAVWEEKGDLLFFHISANRFLRGMVRAIVGTLLDVGSGKISVDDFGRIIHSRDRKKAGANVPPYGLFLAGVKYPTTIFAD